MIFGQCRYWHLSFFFNRFDKIVVDEGTCIPQRLVRFNSFCLVIIQFLIFVNRKLLSRIPNIQNLQVLNHFEYIPLNLWPTSSKYNKNNEDKSYKTTGVSFPYPTKIQQGSSNKKEQKWLETLFVMSEIPRTMVWSPSANWSFHLSLVAQKHQFKISCVVHRLTQNYHLHHPIIVWQLLYRNNG